MLSVAGLLFWPKSDCNSSSSSLPSSLSNHPVTAQHAIDLNLSNLGIAVDRIQRHCVSNPAATGHSSQSIRVRLVVRHHHHHPHHLWPPRLIQCRRNVVGHNDNIKKEVTINLLLSCWSRLGHCQRLSVSSSSSLIKPRRFMVWEEVMSDSIGDRQHHPQRHSIEAKAGSMCGCHWYRHRKLQRGRPAIGDKRRWKVLRQQQEIERIRQMSSIRHCRHLHPLHHHHNHHDLHWKQVHFKLCSPSETTQHFKARSIDLLEWWDIESVTDVT